MIRQTDRPGLPGLPVVGIVLVLWALAVYRLISNAPDVEPALVLQSMAMMAIGMFCLTGLFVVQPNEALFQQTADLTARAQLRDHAP